jgi:hypothetical protein
VHILVLKTWNSTHTALHYVQLSRNQAAHGVICKLYSENYGPKIAEDYNFFKFAQFYVDE